MKQREKTAAAAKTEKQEHMKEEEEETKNTHLNDYRRTMIVNLILMKTKHFIIASCLPVSECNIFRFSNSKYHFDEHIGWTSETGRCRNNNNNNYNGNRMAEDKYVTSPRRQGERVCV